ncbi:MAG: hypothetical protein GX115_14880 [Ruminiclostridium sp.]|nr:hypothetical protein [Ruminiclostridium sp.]
MEISVGNSRYTIPITTIREAIKPLKSNIISDINGHEAIMLRGNCIEILRLYKEFNIDTNITEPEDGILVIVQNETDTFALLADKLLGEHQIVVKPMPDYMGKITGVSGCSILGDGRISLILDIAGLLERNGRAKQEVWE